MVIFPTHSKEFIVPKFYYYFYYLSYMTFLSGNPAPTISLYVGGHLVRQDTSRHMVTTIHNVTTDMEHVSCYADNGFGIPMQASKKVHISCEL